MVQFYFLKPILNHHCTVSWHPLYFRKLVLSSFSKPGDAREKSEKGQSKGKEEIDKKGKISNTREKREKKKPKGKKWGKLK